VWTVLCKLSRQKKCHCVPLAFPSHLLSLTISNSEIGGEPAITIFNSMQSQGNHFLACIHCGIMIWLALSRRLIGGLWLSRWPKTTGGRIRYPILELILLRYVIKLIARSIDQPCPFQEQKKNSSSNNPSSQVMPIITHPRPNVPSQEPPPPPASTPQNQTPPPTEGNNKPTYASQ